MTAITEKLVRVEAPHFVAAIVIAGGVVVEAAPILKYLIGWREARARQYLARKGWSWTKTERTTDELE